MQRNLVQKIYHLILTQSVCEVVTVQYPYAIVPTLVLYFLISVSFPPGDPFLERIEEEPRAVFLHLFRGVVFLSFSAFSGRWFELFTVTFRRVQRFYVCKRRLRGQPQLSIMGQESNKSRSYSSV